MEKGETKNNLLDAVEALMIANAISFMGMAKKKITKEEARRLIKNIALKMMEDDKQIINNGAIKKRL